MLYTPKHFRILNNYKICNSVLIKKKKNRKFRQSIEKADRFKKSFLTRRIEKASIPTLSYSKTVVLLNDFYWFDNEIVTTPMRFQRGQPIASFTGMHGQRTERVLHPHMYLKTTTISVLRQTALSTRDDSTTDAKTVRRNIVRKTRRVARVWWTIVHRLLNGTVYSYLHNKITL